MTTPVDRDHNIAHDGTVDTYYATETRPNSISPTAHSHTVIAANTSERGTAITMRHSSDTSRPNSHPAYTITLDREATLTLARYLLENLT